MNNTNVITIEKNIAMPPIRGYTNHERYNFVDKMDIGDSFVIDKSTPDFSAENTRKHIYLRNASKKSGVKFAVRTLSGRSTNPQSIRVWRIR
tara:strand:+ start:2526 stop:2801 length:276 start_codon:yes stop_codon:yes gene_type:complete